MKKLVLAGAFLAAAVVLPSAVAAQVTYSGSWSPASIVQGQTSTLTLSIANNTAAPVTNATATYTFPFGSWVFANSNGCSGSIAPAGLNVTTNVGVAANTTCNLNFTVTPSTTGSKALNSTPLSYGGGDGASPKAITAGANPTLFVTSNVPTMSEWATILFGAILAGSAGIFIQRQRRLG